MPPERHAEVLEFPQDRTQGPQVAEDEVEPPKSMPKQLMVKSSWPICMATLRDTAPHGTRLLWATVTRSLVLGVAKVRQLISSVRMSALAAYLI